MRRRFTLALAVAALASTLLVGAAQTAPELSLGAQRALVQDVIVEEQKAFKLLSKDPPRERTARMIIERSMETLLDLRLEITSRDAVDQLFEARIWDGHTLAWMDEKGWEGARRALENALGFKQAAIGHLQEQRSGPQCADGRDNDGDGTVDTRHDSGCKDRKDSSEKTALRCGFEIVPESFGARLIGTCDGPAWLIDVTVPAGATLEKASPNSSSATTCRLSSSRVQRCHLRDGLRNPTHRIELRLFLNKPLYGPLKLTLTDFSRRARAFTGRVAAFSLGADPVQATGTFTNGQGGCPVATSFTDSFLFLAPGNGTLTISQPSTGDSVKGPIKPDGSFELKSDGESYKGRIVGSAATATYSYKTASGCTETYDARFTLAR